MTCPICGHPGPTLIDLFCGAGGCTRGYQLAGFHVLGVDNRPQPRYVGDHFVQADALTYPLDGFDANVGSPPCHDHSSVASFTKSHGTGWMLDATRQRFIESGKPYVIENVERAEMPGTLILCGASFGLGAGGYALRRHRRFESKLPLMGPGCACPRRVAGVYGHGETSWREGRRGHSFNKAQAREAMRIDWMNRDELAQAIPPAYTTFIGEQLLSYLNHEPTQDLLSGTGL